MVTAVLYYLVVERPIGDQDQPIGNENHSGNIQFNIQSTVINMLIIHLTRLASYTRLLD